MVKCNGKNCETQLSDSEAEMSPRIIAGHIPIWLVKRPERRLAYARRNYGARCESCRARIIKELQA